LKIILSKFGYLRNYSYVSTVIERDMNNNDLREAIIFNLQALYKGIINEADFVQAIEEELNK
jgi:hypothetical protein